jgi:hypothetical protein
MKCLENNEDMKNYQSKDNNLLFYLIEIQTNVKAYSRMIRLKNRYLTNRIASSNFLKMENYLASMALQLVYPLELDCDLKVATSMLCLH